MKISGDLKLARVVPATFFAAMLLAPQLAHGQEVSNSEQSSTTVSETLDAALLDDIPDELRDIAFDRFIDLQDIGRAWGRLDAAALADIALQLREGERVLLRSHKAIKGSKVMELTLKLATKNQDQETLARLALAAKNSGDQELSQRIAAATKLAAASRSTEAPLMLSAGETTVEGFIEIQSLLNQLNAIGVTSDTVSLNKFMESVVQSIHLSDKQRDQLIQMAAQAKSGIAQQNDIEGDSTVDALDKLAGSSRSNKPYYYKVVYSDKLRATRDFDTYEAAVASRKLDVAPPRRFECSDVFVTPTLFSFPAGVRAKASLPPGLFLLSGKDNSFIADANVNPASLVGNDGASAVEKKAAIEDAKKVQQVQDMVAKGLMVAAGGGNLAAGRSLFSVGGVRKLVYKKR